nr:MAG TPA: hypothetical protein [Caudoviricetes sp.]
MSEKDKKEKDHFGQEAVLFKRRSSFLMCCLFNKSRGRE